MGNHLTIKGQVTIPKTIRDYLGLTCGSSAVSFSIAKDGTVQLIKAKPVATSMRSAHGNRGEKVLSLLAGCCV